MIDYIPSVTSSFKNEYLFISGSVPTEFNDRKTSCLVGEFQTSSISCGFGGGGVFDGGGGGGADCEGSDYCGSGRDGPGDVFFYIIEAGDGGCGGSYGRVVGSGGAVDDGDDGELNNETDGFDKARKIRFQRTKQVRLKKYDNESNEARVKSRENNKVYLVNRKVNESDEARLNRLKRMKEYRMNKRASESKEAKLRRLKREREYRMNKELVNQRKQG